MACARVWDAVAIHDADPQFGKTRRACLFTDAGGGLAGISTSSRIMLLRSKVNGGAHDAQLHTQKAETLLQAMAYGAHQIGCVLLQCVNCVRMTANLHRVQVAWACALAPLALRPLKKQSNEVHYTAGELGMVGENVPSTLHDLQ
eukprot:scaffold9819_cov21-Tisochrysis_lutea.AAC.4